MKKGYLSEFFKGIAFKHLSAVECESHISHQHEFNGVKELKTLLGAERREFAATFLYMQDDDAEPVIDTGKLTWYDAREAHPKRSEYRLYYPETMVSINSSEGDLLVIARRLDDTLLVIVAERNSAMEHQLLWLFGVSNQKLPQFSVKGEEESDQIKLEFAARYILEQIGIEQTDTDETLLSGILGKFNDKFPATREFSAFARETLSDISAHDDPDSVILAWMDREEILFRTLERHLVEKRLEQGFIDENRVDTFLNYSMSVLNRRKSRAGSALENHLEFLFQEENIRFSRTPETERRARPDFLFPGINEYNDRAFPAISLNMLGVKRTCKDRWRQILTEADRIDVKHLFTLEPAISKNQTDEMASHRVVLVLPQKIHGTYTLEQKSVLINLSDFVKIVKARQKT
jgi:hypothetical protein